MAILPKRPKQNFWDKVKDTFDANSTADQYRRAVAYQKSPVSPLRAPTNYVDEQKMRGNSRPNNNVGQAFLGNTARAVNLVKAGTTFNTKIAPAIGTYGVGKLINSDTLKRAGTRGLNIANADLDKDLSPTGGLFGAGTPFDSAKQAGNASFGTIVKKSVGTGAGVFGEVSPVGASGGIARRTAIGVTEAALGDAGSQLANNGKINPLQTAQSAAFGAVLPNVIPSVKFVGKGGKKAATAVVETAPKVKAATSPFRDIDAQILSYQKAFDTETNPKLRKDISAGITDLNNQRRKMSQGGYVKNPLANDGQAPKPSGAPVIDPTPPKTKPVVTMKEAFVPGEAKPIVNAVQADALPTRMNGGTGRVYERDMNVSNYELDDMGKQALSDMSGKKVKTLTNKDVEEAADFVGIDRTRLTDRETQAILAGRLNQSRQVTTEIDALGQLKKNGASEAELLAQARRARQSVVVDQNQKTFAGRLLQAERINKSKLSPEDKFIRMLVLSGADTNKIDNVLVNLDLSTPEAAIKAWREAVPATAEDWLTKYRYTNMLSSPLTHIVNVLGNLQSVTGIRPLTMAVQGTLDAMRATATGGARKSFAGEAPRFMKGAVQSVGSAIDDAFDSMGRYSSYAQNPDLVGDMNTPLAIGGFKGKADSLISYIPKLLNAGDVLFRKISTGGEEAALNYRASRGVDVGDIAEQASKNADYTLFRQELGAKEQGKVLQSLDFIPAKINEARRSNNIVIRTVANHTFPFVLTPTNLFKQGIEYSPLGFTTMVGNTNKTAQAAKALMGTTTVALAAGTFAANDAITGAAPSDSKEREAFMAEGKQPYSVKIGDKWFGYSKLHPAIAFNLATVGILKDTLDKGTIDQSGADKVASFVGGMLGYYRDQSYFKGIGDFVNVLQGVDASSIGSTLSSVAANSISQYLPLQSFENWLGRLIKETDTKIDYTANFMQQMQQRLFKDYPMATGNAGAIDRENPYTGESVQRENQVLNAFSPVKVTNDKGYGNTTSLSFPERQAMQTADDKDAFRNQAMLDKGVDRMDKKKLKEIEAKDSGSTTLPSGKIVAKVGDSYKTFKDQKSADIATAKDEFSNSDEKSRVVGDTFLYKSSDGSVKSKPKIMYDFEQADAKLNLEMDRAFEAKDLSKWSELAQQKYDALETKKTLYNSGVEQDEIDKITLAQENLMDKAAKYATKGFGGSGGGGSNKVSLKSYLQGPKQVATLKGSTSLSKTVKSGARVRSIVRPKVTMRKSKV